VTSGEARSITWKAPVRAASECSVGLGTGEVGNRTSSGTPSQRSGSGRPGRRASEFGPPRRRPDPPPVHRARAGPKRPLQGGNRLRSPPVCQAMIGPAAAPFPHRRPALRHPGDPDGSHLIPSRAEGTHHVSQRPPQRGDLHLDPARAGGGARHRDPRPPPGSAPRIAPTLLLPDWPNGVGAEAPTVVPGGVDDDRLDAVVPMSRPSRNPVPPATSTRCPEGFDPLVVACLTLCISVTVFFGHLDQAGARRCGRSSRRWSSGPGPAPRPRRLSSDQP